MTRESDNAARDRARRQKLPIFLNRISEANWNRGFIDGFTAGLSHARAESDEKLKGIHDELEGLLEIGFENSYVVVEYRHDLRILLDREFPQQADQEATDEK